MYNQSYTTNIIATFIVLHNLCIINNVGIEIEWIVEA